MRYKDLDIDDLFKIDRENNNIVYVKKGFYFIEAQNPMKAYRKLNASTKVTKIGR